MHSSSNSNTTSESIVYRLQNIYFKNEQLNSSISVLSKSQNSNVSNEEYLELISNKRRYLSELEEAHSNNLINDYCFNLISDKLQNQFNPESYYSYLANDNVINQIEASFVSASNEFNKSLPQPTENEQTFESFERFREEFLKENIFLPKENKAKNLNFFNANKKIFDVNVNDYESIDFLFDHKQADVKQNSSDTLSAITNNLDISNRQPVQTSVNSYNENKPQYGKINTTNNTINNSDSNMNVSQINPVKSSNYIQKVTTIKYEPRVSKCYKRRNDDDEMETNSNSDLNNESKLSAFKSAKEQLIIDNAKQSNNGNTYNSGNNQAPIKKSLGTTKRGIHSKFNLPIPKTNEDTNDNGQQQNTYATKPFNSNNGNSNNGTTNDYSNELDMSKMKNIEPKLIETIMSEILDQTAPITWNDIAGLEFVKKTIKEIVIWPMLRPDIFNGLRGPPKGLLLFGPPGTGKTLIAKCIANESKSKFFNISSSSLTSKWQGESEKLVKVLFEVARSFQPSVIFIDEIDSLLAARSDDDRESSRRLKTEFFVQMDGARTSGDERILLIGATNRPQELDDAARRRFVKRLYIPLPEKEGRKQIIRNLMNKQESNLNEDEVDTIAVLTEGYSGADMTNLCREAALGPIRMLEVSSIETIDVDQVQPINYNHFEDAMKQVRASVSQDDLEQYYKWNTTFGSNAISKN